MDILTLKPLISSACVGLTGDSSFSLESIDGEESLRASFSVQTGDREDDVENFWVTFAINSTDYVQGVKYEYLTVSWWIPGEHMLSLQPLTDDALLPLINDLNIEPGVKCRIDLASDRSDPNDFVVVEADLLTSGLVRAQVDVTLARTHDFVAHHTSQLRGHLTASLNGLI